MHRGLKVLLAVTVAALATAAATLAAGSGSAATSDTLVFGTTVGADFTRRRGRLRRRVAPGDRPAHRGSRRAQARVDDHPAAARPFVEGHEQRSGVDVQPPPRRPVPRRHAVQRPGGLRELRPVVQLHRPVRVRRDLLLLLHRLHRLQEEGGGARQQAALPQLPGTEPVDGRGHAAARERRVPGCAVADVVPHPEPDRDDAVRGEQGSALERRRLHADRRVRCSRRPGRRYRAVQARVVEDRRSARDRAERPVLGQEGDPATRDLPGNPGQRRPSAGAPDRGDPGLRPRRAAGHPDDQEEQQAEGARPSGVQRRVRDDQPEGQALRQPARPPGRRPRARPRQAS